MSQVLFDCAVLVATLLCIRFLRRQPLKTPPGPSGYPLLGNVFDLMVPEWWKTAESWGSKYGPVVYLKSLGQPMILINSYEVAVDLFEKRPLVYSDRPNSVMINELQRFDWMFSSLNYGEQLRALRTPVQKFFEPSNILEYEDVQKNEVKKLLSVLLKDPKKYEQHIRMTMASTLMIITYGHEINSFDDPIVSIARSASEYAETALQQGTFLVDIIPWLKYIPKWFPGAGFQTVAERGAKFSHDLRFVPYYNAREKALSGLVTRSFISQQMEDRAGAGGTLSKEDDEVISATTGICYSAGASTSVSALKFFLLAMTLHPEVQRRAQEEIDRVVGSSRLPELSDRPQLPYCTAMLKEVHRWCPILPLGVAHATREADTYAGYFIPANAIVLPNCWAMLKDPVEYPEPNVFRPERFLPKAGEQLPRDPTKIQFGFGRRVCPGKALAENMIFLVATQILTVFNISKAKGEDGTVIEPVVNIHSEGVVQHPDAFECDISPRSAEAVGLIQAL